MTPLQREALQMCLEYIETDAHERRHVRWKINEALAEQPAQSLPFGVGGGLVAIKTLLSRDPCGHANTAIQMIDAILAEQPAQQQTWKQGGLVTLNQDPYPAMGAWFVQFWEGEEVAARVYGNDRETLGLRCSMLNAALQPPAQRKPLTETEIRTIRRDLAGTLDVQYVKFARAIEAKHNIKENT